MSNLEILTDPDSVTGVHMGPDTIKRVTRELLRIEKKIGRVPQDEDVYEAARDPESPLHKIIFDVDEKSAARAYYIARVQWLMRSIRAIVVTEDGERYGVRMYVRGAEGVEKISEVSPDSFTAKSISRALANELESVKRRCVAWAVFRKGTDAQEVVRHLNAAETLFNAIETQFGAA